MKLLLLPRYDRLGASSRLRIFQYLPALVNAGIECTVSILFADDYVKALYGKRSLLLPTIRGYMRRRIDLLRWRKVDVVLLEKEVFPWLPAWFELMMLPKRASLVIDYDDAVFHRYDEHASRVVRWALGRKIDMLMRRADTVLAGNEYLAARAETAGCRNVLRIPTVIDLERYPSPAINQESTQVVVGWIGSPATAGYLKMVSAVAIQLQRHHAVRFIAVGARADQVQGTPFEAIDWTEDGEAEAIRGFDIGIMPLPDAPWERGKCGYKLIQYMACGLPVVASPVGVNRQIVQSGVNGLLADSDQKWLDALDALIGNSELRRQLGSAGRAEVETRYAVQVTAPLLVQELCRLAPGGPQGA